MAYNFKKEAEIRYEGVSGKICSIYEDYSKHVLALGQLKTLFGEPLYVSENLENQFEYCISATDEAGNTFYLSAYSGPSGPSIGGCREAKEAALALVALIQEAAVSDYEYEGYYLDGPCKVRMGVKDGQPYEEEEVLDLSDEEMVALFQKFF